MSANLVFLNIFILICCNISSTGFAQKEKPLSESNDPIRESIARKEHKLDGMNLTEKEFNYLQRINEKYRLTGKEQKLRRSYRDTLNIKGRFGLARSYRKEYVMTKKVEKFRKKKFESIQNKETIIRMHEKEKRAKKRYRREKRKARKRKFLNLFK
ncbi:MAG: hypothetical protein ABFS35_00120 [Bacteroidota bacterium]